jgi:glycerophosphoryl diester phosphodiesterase
VSRWTRYGTRLGRDPSGPSTPLVVGHRGGRGDGWPPENTIEAFEHARGQGALAIELDARTSADGRAVVFHDVALDRMTGGRRTERVCDLAGQELARIDLGRGARLPLLADALAWAREKGVSVNVELKHDVPDRRRLAHASVRAISEHGADVLVSSFDPLLVAAALALLPATPRALLLHDGQRLWATAAQELCRPPFVQALHLQRTQRAAHAPEKYRARGLRVGVWTVNDPREAIDLARGGVETIITDAPGAVLAAMCGRS